jgi:hypothetical protein
MFIDTTPTFAQNVAGSLGTLAGKGLSNYFQNKQLRSIQQQNKDILRQEQDLLANQLESQNIPRSLAYFPKDIRDIYLKQYLENQYINNLITPTTTPDTTTSDTNTASLPGLPGLQINPEFIPDNSNGRNLSQSQISSMASRYTPDQIARITLKNPSFGNLLLKEKEAQQREDIANRKLQQRDSEFNQKQNLEERKFAFQTNQDYQKSVSKNRESLKQQQDSFNALQYANATGDLGFWSKDNLANLTGIDGLRSKEGAIFQNAAKNYFLGDIGNIPGRSNQLLQRTLLDSYAKIGTSQEARDSVLQIYQGKINKLQRYLNTYDAIVQEETERYGYIQPNIEARVNQRLENVYKEEDQATIQRIKNIKKGLGFYYSRDFSNPENYLNAPKGTPLTQPVVNYFLQRNNGDPRLAEAEAYRNGYRVKK